jgi:hypothetical protein
VRLLVVATILVFNAYLPQSDQPYELKGEAPGMTLKQFKSNHKHSDCLRRSETLTNCHVNAGVSYAGVPAQTFKGCATEECTFQGIFADFVDGRMVRLRYDVSLGSAEEIITSLRGKYGEPAEATKTSATWKNSVGYLRVSNVWGPPGHPLDSYTEIVSALNDAGRSADI